MMDEYTKTSNCFVYGLFQSEHWKQFAKTISAWVKELTPDITPDMIPERYRPIAELIGVENFIKLADYSKGDTFYIPSSEFFLRPIRDQRIREEYKGNNTRQLAQKFKISERRVREIVYNS
jgi:Mor family transcriptional regulator